MSALEKARRFWRKPTSQKIRALRATLGGLAQAGGLPPGRQRHPGKPGTMRVHQNGQAFSIAHRGTGADLGAIAQCFDQQQYEIPPARAGYREKADAYYGALLAAGRIPLILDCGANIGASALWFHARYPKAHIVAVEPARDNVALLRQNLAGHPIDARAAAIGATDGSTRLSDPGEGAWGYRTGEDAEGGYEVPLVAIATLLAETSLDRFEPFLLKLDIEGAERTLFDADTSPAARFPVIAIEIHDWLFPGERTASGFFRFHAAAGRDFLFHAENVFSLDHPRLAAPPGR